MARKSKSKILSTTTHGRDFNISITRTPLPRVMPSFGRNVPMLPLSSLMDGRTFHPLPKRFVAPRLTNGYKAPVKSTITTTRKANLYETQKFVLPAHTATCVRRSRRKEVLFAAGSGGRPKRIKSRRSRRTQTSHIKC